MGFRWDKEAHSNWKDKVSFELIEIRQHIAAIEAQLNALSTGKGIGAREPSGRATSSSDFTDISQFKFYKQDALAKIPDIEEMAGGKEKGELGTELVKATYALKSATIAARGYLMLLGNLGLPADQQKLIRELQYSMMAIMKTAQALKILHAAYIGTINPVMGVALAGGYAASGMAYSMKTTGGLV